MAKKPIYDYESLTKSQQQCLNLIETLGIYELRALARVFGDAAPTTIKRDDHIRIVMDKIISGEDLKPIPLRQGRPYKELSNIQGILAELSQISGKDYAATTNPLGSQSINRAVVTFNQVQQNIVQQNLHPIQCRGVLRAKNNRELYFLDLESNKNILIKADAFPFLQADDFVSGTAVVMNDQNEYILSSASFVNFENVHTYQSMFESKANAEKKANAENTPSAENKAGAENGTIAESKRAQENFATAENKVSQANLATTENASTAENATAQENSQENALVAPSKQLAVGSKNILLGSRYILKGKFLDNLSLLKNTLAACKKNNIITIALIPNIMYDDIFAYGNTKFDAAFMLRYEATPFAITEAVQTFLRLINRLQQLGKDLALFVEDLPTLANAIDFNFKSNTKANMGHTEMAVEAIKNIVMLACARQNGSTTLFTTQQESDLFDQLFATSVAKVCKRI